MNNIRNLCFILLCYISSAGCSRSQESPPLEVAIEKQNYPLADKLLSSGEDPNEKDAMGATPLTCAVFNDDTMALKLLLSHRANIWSNLIAADGTTFNICQDGVGGSDSGDGSITIGDGNALGTLAGTRVAGSSLTPVSTLAIPSIRSIGNKLTVSLNQFLIR